MHDMDACRQMHNPIDAVQRRRPVGFAVDVSNGDITRTCACSPDGRNEVHPGDFQRVAYGLPDKAVGAGDEHFGLRHPASSRNSDAYASPRAWPENFCS